jgi:phage baseplate assembly protein W
MAEGLVYKGIAFPFGKGGTGLPAAAGDDEVVKQSLIQIVQTGMGERVMRPEVGSKASSFVFENNDVLLQALISTELSRAIAAQEPRVQVRRIGVEIQNSDVIVTIEYFVPATSTLDRVSEVLGTTAT